MNQKHKKELMDFERKENEKKQKLGSLHQHFHSAPSKKMKMATNVNQKQMELLSAMWTATSLRPFKAVEDNFLQQMIDFASSTNGKLKLPSRNLNRENIIKLAEWIEMEMKNQIHREMDFFLVQLTCGRAGR